MSERSKEWMHRRMTASHAQMHTHTHTHTHTYAHRANVIIDWYRRASCVQSNEITVDLLISQHIVKLGRFVFL
jgi:hypothetical protein